jgi:hypothetical protein
MAPHQSRAVAVDSDAASLTSLREAIPGWAAPLLVPVPPGHEPLAEAALG